MASSSVPSGAGGAVYRTELGSTDVDALTVAVLRGVAAARDCAPGDLDLQLYDHLDLDAVEGLYAAGGTGWHLEAAVDGHAVRFHGDGTLLVD